MSTQISGIFYRPVLQQGNSGQLLGMCDCYCGWVGWQLRKSCHSSGSLLPEQQWSLATKAHGGPRVDGNNVERE